MATILKGESMMYKYLILIASKLKAKCCFIHVFYGGPHGRIADRLTVFRL